MLSEDETTLLVITGSGIPPYSARGLTQTLQPISQVENSHRTVNGDLIDVSATQFRKFKSVISGADVNTPALDGIWPGMTLEIDCLATLSYLTEGGSPSRPAVSGSSYTEGSYTIYRPHITFMVMDYQTSEDEYGAVVTWSLTLEEV